jgi:hypothetical protein
VAAVSMVRNLLGTHNTLRHSTDWNACCLDLYVTAHYDVIVVVYDSLGLYNFTAKAVLMRTAQLDPRAVVMVGGGNTIPEKVDRTGQWSVRRGDWKLRDGYPVSWRCALRL